MLNHIVLQGRFTHEPELRYTQGGTPVCSFSLAVEKDYAGADGKRGADFIDCTAWRGAAEFVSKYFHKGSAAIVEGRLEQHDWTDRDGNKRKSMIVTVSNVHFAESKKSEPAGANQAAQFGAMADKVERTFGGFADIDDKDGELPF